MSYEINEADATLNGNAIYRAGGTDVPVADGGTGASTAAAARTNLDVQSTAEVNAKANHDYMGVYITTPAATTISVAGTFVKMAGTTSITNQSTDMDDGATTTSNRVRYTGTDTKHFHVVAQATISLVSGTNQNVALQVYHYDDSAATGTLLAHSEARATISGTQEFQITTHADLMMDTNDYLEIHVTNNTNTNNVQAEEAYLFAMSMPM